MYLDRLREANSVVQSRRERVTEPADKEYESGKIEGGKKCLEPARAQQH